MIQNVFNRIEKKYLLNKFQSEQVMNALGKHMEIDEYGLHTIRNIYYDTSDQELIRTSLDKPCYKEKFRVRCYGEPKEDTKIFLEIKKKYQGIVNKRRIALPYKEAMAYLDERRKPENTDWQIFREIDYFLEHYHLRPEVYLAYDRIALFGKENPEFRVTFDQNIRSRNFALSLDCDTDTTPLLEEGYRLMEVKISDALPLWFVDILNQNQIQNTSFSKYGNVYRNNLISGVYQYSLKEENQVKINTKIYAQSVQPGILVPA